MKHIPSLMLACEAAEGSISAKASECESLFTKSLQILNSNGEHTHEAILRKLEKRFLDWAAYLGVFAGVSGSLDQCLEHHPQYRDLILLVLDMLNMNLVQSKMTARISLGLQAD